MRNEVTHMVSNINGIFEQEREKKGKRFIGKGTRRERRQYSISIGDHY